MKWGSGKGSKGPAVAGIWRAGQRGKEGEGRMKNEGRSMKYEEEEEEEERLRRCPTLQISE